MNICTEADLQPGYCSSSDDGAGAQLQRQPLPQKTLTEATPSPKTGEFAKSWALA
jgi:hypothetical protein